MENKNTNLRQKYLDINKIYMLGKYFKNTDTCVYIFGSRAKGTAKRVSDIVI
jgi:predicted nucleotidyltransferase